VVEISTLKKRIKKLKSERAELESTFRELQQRKQEKLLAQATELANENKELRAKIEAMEFNSDDDDETE
jgi:prefoldin subunit 5